MSHLNYCVDVLLLFLPHSSTRSPVYQESLKIALYLKNKYPNIGSRLGWSLRRLPNIDPIVEICWIHHVRINYYWLRGFCARWWTICRTMKTAETAYLLNKLLLLFTKTVPCRQRVLFAFAGQKHMSNLGTTHWSTHDDGRDKISGRHHNDYWEPKKA